ncbi:hypothetical protein GQ457_06G014130 [Hibiscus cannabinus]
MGETRLVPRRESPWGMPEGEHRQPKAHRCNDQAEDVIQKGNSTAFTFKYLGLVSWTLLKGACFEGNPFKTVPGPLSSFGSACTLNLGREKLTDPYTYLQLDPPKREALELHLLGTHPSSSP